jgi:curved DNA-binding protein CbpA
MNNTKYNKTEFNNTIIELHNDPSFNPYLVLNISTQFTEEELKKQYKYYALKTHPDKEGNPEHFTLVSKSYIYLLKVLKDNLPVKDIIELKEGFNEVVLDQAMNQKQNIKLDKDFNIQEFNNVFSEYRTNSDTDRGYADFLKETQIEQPKSNSNIFSDNFNLSLFNKLFNTKNEIKKTGRQMVKVEAPKEMCNNGGYELGVCDVSDFSKNYNITDSTGLDYTDVKVAYTTSKLVDESQVEINEWKDLEHLQKERSNISFELSDRNKVLVEQQQLFSEQKETDRIHNLKIQDNESTQKFNKLHKLMVGN